MINIFFITKEGVKIEENTEKITVKLKYDPNKDDIIKVNIKPNATVSELEKKVKDTLVTLDDVPMGILKFNEQELDNKNKTLNELGIEDGSIIENENRVFLRTLNGKEIGITCDENTTVREFLKQLKSKNPRFSYIRLVFAGASLQKSTLDQKLLGCQMGTSSIKYGAILRLIIPIQLGIMYKSDTVFDLNNLEESKNSNLLKVSETLATNKNVFNLESSDNHPEISLGSKKESKNSNYPLLRIIVGIADLLLLAAAVATFLLYFLTTLSLSVAVPIVLAALFVVGSILFFGWDKVLPKILPDDWLKEPDLQTNLGEKDNDQIKKIEYGKNNPEEKKEYEKEKEYN